MQCDRGVTSPRAPRSRRGAGAAQQTALRVPKARPPSAAAPRRLSSAEWPSKPSACARLSMVEQHSDFHPVTRRLPPPLLSSAERSPFADLRRRRASRAARAWDHPWHRPYNFTLHSDGSSRTATDGFRWSRRCWRLRHATNVLVYLWTPRHTAHSRGDGPSATDVPAQLPCGNCQPS